MAASLLLSSSGREDGGMKAAKNSVSEEKTGEAVLYTVCDCFIPTAGIYLVQSVFFQHGKQFVCICKVDIEQTGLGHRPITCLHIVKSEVTVEDKREAVIHKAKFFMPTESVSIVS